MQVKISEEMEMEGEYGKIRIPRNVMKASGYTVGGFMQVRSKLGDIIHLVIDESKEEGEAAELTEKDFSRAFIRNKRFAIKPVENIMLGCDPEVFLVDLNNKVVPAYRFFPKNGPIGNDGVVMEFRPAPDASEDVVASNLHHLLKRARSSLNNTAEGQALRIVAVSSIGKLTAGFHLHYGLPDRLLGFDGEVKMVAELITHVMDYYVGIPSIIPEGTVDSARRIMPYVPYGKPGQFRIDKRTFEYRMPGSANLKHPTLTRGLMALGAVVVEDFVSRIKKLTANFSELKELHRPDMAAMFYKNLPNYNQICEISCCPNTNLAQQHVESFIINDVRKMIGYVRRKDIIEQYFVAINKEIQSYMELNWNFG